MVDWSKSWICKRKDNMQSHIFINHKPFKPSYMEEPVAMGWLIGMEYSRMWLKERDEFVRERKDFQKMKVIPNDYMTWVNKRKNAKKIIEANAAPKRV